MSKTTVIDNVNEPSLPSSFLSSLNSAQIKAVQHPPEVPLQILAGPGSGKTRVLTSRIAYLITHGLDPSSICAVTFTNKAANEMRVRLIKLIGKQKTSAIKMGTFHALCSRFLRSYGNTVGLTNNFTICDVDECKKIIANILKPWKDLLVEKNIELKDRTVLSMISKAKSKSIPASDYLNFARLNQERKTGESGAPNNDVDQIVAEVYESYETALRRSNSVDFDDLLIYGVKLFTKHKAAVEWCQHVLVDEFQDTNITQYELMKALAIAQCVTVVGDPDQSIYGWRSAEVGNLGKMQNDFPSTVQIFLEENYRSTAAILNASLAIIAQDKTRIQKSLHTSHPKGVTPLLRFLETEKHEADFIAGEIKRIVALMGGILHYGDFAVLLRFNALSRTIENALQKEGIPSRILAGHRFFERLEIKDLLAYLQLVDNSSFNPAFARAVNVPGRGIGEKTIAEIATRAELTKISQLEVIERIHDGKAPDVKPAVKRKLEGFVRTIRMLRKHAVEGMSPADLIQNLLELVDYENHLKKTQPDWDVRWENVKELITFASEVDVSMPQESSSADEPTDSPLRSFLQASMLSSEGDSQKDDSEKVTISTCHAAKGLEWPVVLIPAVEEGTFPLHRSDDTEEERRLLYVACTRAQGLLYLTHVGSRKVAGESKNKTQSDFITAVTKQNPAIFSNRRPTLHEAKNRAVTSKILGRPIPDDAEVQRRFDELYKTHRHLFREQELLAERDAPRNYIVTAAQAWGSAVKLFIEPQPTIPFRFERPDVQLIYQPDVNPRHMYNRALIIDGPPTVGKPAVQPQTSGKRQVMQASAPPTACEVKLPFQNHTMSWPSQPKSSQSKHLIPRVGEKPQVSIPSTSFDQNTLPCQGRVVHNASPNSNTPQGIVPVSPVLNAPVKRRLGMGRGTVSYSNKKFKPPT